MGAQLGHAPDASGGVGEVAVNVIDGRDVERLAGGVVRRVRRAGGPASLFNGGSIALPTWRRARRLGAAQGKQGARAAYCDALPEGDVVEGAIIAPPPRRLRRDGHGEGGPVLCFGIRPAHGRLDRILRFPRIGF